MSDPALGLLMLSLIVVVIMLGFPTAFTLMGLGMVFGFGAFYEPGAPWLDNGSLVRLGSSAPFVTNVPSPHAHYLCWRTGMMDRWECAAFAEWLKQVLA